MIGYRSILEIVKFSVEVKNSNFLENQHKKKLFFKYSEQKKLFWHETSYVSK
jgi:hypothetical protein